MNSRVAAGVVMVFLALSSASYAEDGDEELLGSGGSAAKASGGYDGIRMSAALDFGFKPWEASVKAPPNDTGDSLDRWQFGNNYNVGIKIQPHKYFAIGAWFGNTPGNADENKMNADIMSSNLNGGFFMLAQAAGCGLDPHFSGEMSEACRDNVTLPYKDLYLKYHPEYTASKKYLVGPAFGFDANVVIPVLDNLSIWGGPGVVWQKAQTWYWNPDAPSVPMMLEDHGREARFAWSAGANMKFGHWLSDTAVIKNLMVTGGYHSVRGATFGLGVAY